jgi:hypothetical protein
MRGQSPLVLAAFGLAMGYAAERGRVPKTFTLAMNGGQTIVVDLR